MLATLTNAPRGFDWGSRSLIADLEGRAPADAPEAEVWFGDHPSDPADVLDGTGRTLEAWIRDEGVGDGARLPYLLKLLAASKALSIQVHPTKAQAEAGYRRETDDAPAVRNYVDDNHKPEMIVALSDRFVALCGLREPAATKRLLAALGEAAAPLAARATDAASLTDAVGWLLSGEADEVVAAILAALGDARSTEFATELSVARDNAADFPGDAGVVVGLLMNLVVLRRGEGLFLGAGQLHSYQSGLGVEIMAASDNVLRGGLTSKHIDVGELMRILAPEAGPVPVVLPRAFNGGSHGFEEYPAPVRDFRLLRAEVSPARPARVAVSGPAIALCVAGSVTVREGADQATIPAGRAVIVAGAGEVSVEGSGEVFLAEEGA
ncbi:mannose-6-phosphate isomerase, class I [Microbacterium excoecariae]|uniref:mannose-6-phosphate isomerase, class I n=1 Tax=Microbacterium excoecariae TaxID=2715210 RepID=UPI00140B41C2|nr:mannose-6-phosphate isomerase, class I [Microbacterium excoecariae]NHI17457.1 mannose-6-phosphate isomerase, class I [Microbacterium excoecariae]